MLVVHEACPDQRAGSLSARGNNEMRPDDGIPVLGRGWLAFLPYASSSEDTTLLSRDDIRSHVKRPGETWMSV